MIEVQIPKVDISITPGEIDSLPSELGGVYVIYEEYGVAYVGRSVDLKNRVRAHIRNRSNINFKNGIIKVDIRIVESIWEQEIYETFLIKETKPRYNSEKTERDIEAIALRKKTPTRLGIQVVFSEQFISSLKPFESIEQLESDIKLFTAKYRKQLNTTDLSVIEAVLNDSKQYNGVCFLSKNEIGSLVNKSRRQVIRVCQKLELLGVIKQLEMKRHTDMLQTSNAIIFNRYIENEEETE